MVLSIFKRRIFELYGCWVRLRYINYIFVSVILMIVLTVPFAVVFEILGVSDSDVGGPDLKGPAPGEIIFLAIIVAPVIETLFAQLIPIRLVQKYIKRNTDVTAITISSIIFAAGHLSYSVWYFLLMLPIGFILAVTYITFQKRKQSGYWTTTLLHAVRNSLALLVTLRDFVP